MNYYERLGVPKDALPDFIKAAYRRKISKAHSDREGGNHEEAVEINNAYLVLSDPEKRALYDLTGEHDLAALETFAQQILMSKVMEWVNKIDNVDAHDMMTYVLGALGNDTQTIDTNERHGNNTLDRLRRARRRVRFHGRGKNILCEMLDGQIASIETQLKRVAHDRKKVRRAIELAADYRFDFEQPMTGTFHVHIGPAFFGR